MFKRILVAVDGSQTGELALQTAIRLAAELQAQLRIVHAANIANLNEDAEFPNRSRLAENTIKHGRDILSGSQASAASAGVAAETTLITIDTLKKRIPEVIAEDAETWPADLIVIGTHGRRGLARLFLGSVAEGVARVASKPVLLVREE
ncbi:MAG: universal stress protein [Betaproteobacteria bacterium HGW-Betaproteobacteria-17]|nr:MAG: universal stress protein [Betaproteobacteria bacterium HGW-Betaproteobacteria-17]